MSNADNKYVVYKSSRLPAYPSYAGPAWDGAGIRGRYQPQFASLEEATELARLLSEANPLGFRVALHRNGEFYDATEYAELERRVIDANTYSPSGTSRIVPAPNSKWLIVGASYRPGVSVPTYWDIHYNDDDPNVVPIDPAEWNPLPDGKVHSAALHRRYTRVTRLALARATCR